MITAAPIQEMRTALDQAIGAPSGGYAAGLAQGQPILRVHIQELRDRVLAVWNSGTSGADVRWLVTDQLGTPRIILDKSGSLSGITRHDYLPFGEELYTASRTAQLGYTNSDGERQKFTGKERDNETGLDYFGSRYYTNTQGRFTSVDPLSGEQKTPQSWNRYSYTLNNPLKFVDPDGSRYVQRTLANGQIQYGWCGTEDCYNNAIDSTRQDYAGWTPVSFDETQPYVFRARGTGGDLYGMYVLFPDGRNGYVNDFNGVGTSIDTDWAAQLTIGSIINGIFGLANYGVETGSAMLASEAAGGTALSGLYGEVPSETLAAIERSAASEAKVEVFTKLTQSPVLGKSLHIALDEGGAAAARTEGQIYSAKIPQALLDQLERAGLATRGNLVWEGGKQVSVQYHILPQASKFIIDYFK